MAATRYFKATDGVVTVFRASKTRIYQSAWFTRHEGETRPVGDQGFSAAVSARHPYLARHGQTACRNVPVVEIEKAEYDRLVAIKNQRFDNPKYASPQDSWIRNAELDQAEAA